MRTFKKLLVALVAASALLAFHAAPASAGTTALTVEFAGSATTSPLCLPGLDDSTATCLPNAALTPDTGDWRFVIPSAALPAPAPPVSFCSVTGVLNSVPVSDTCTMDVDGALTAVAPLVRPHCGISAGDSTALGGVAPDEFTFVAGGAHAVTVEWVATAGGTIPVTGTFNDGSSVHDFAGVVQARPVGAAGTVACVNAPAVNFTVIGTIEVV